MDSKNLKSKMSSSNSTSPTISVSSSAPMSNLASGQPSTGKPGSPPNSTNAAGDDEEEMSQFMIYYLLGGIYLRPVGFVTGSISQQFASTKPYPLRRSSGQIEVVPYEQANEAMRNDFDYVIESNISPQNTSSLTISLQDEANVNVYGELFGGYSFEAPSQIELNGTLHIAYWTDHGLAEDAINCSAHVKVTKGTASLFVCDHKHLVLMYDSESLYTIGLLQEEGEQVAQDGTGSGKSAHAAEILKRITSAAKHSQPSESDKPSQKSTDGAPSVKKTVTFEKSPSETSTSSSKSSSLNKGKIQLKRKSKSAKNPLNDVQWMKPDEKDKKAAASSPGLAAQVLNSILNWRSSSSPKSPAKSPSKSSSGKSNIKKNGFKTNQLRQRPKNEPNVKLAKSKFNVPTPSSSHNLNNSLSRTKSASQARSESSQGKNKPLVRSPNRTQPRNVSKAAVSTNRPASLASIKSNASSSSVQTRSMARIKSQMIKTKAELNQLLQDMQQLKEDPNTGEHELKEKMSSVIEVLQTLVDSTGGSTQKQLVHDLAELREYSGNLSADHIDEYSEKIAAIAKKIDNQLEAN